jgi:hypothetical protein
MERTVKDEEILINTRLTWMLTFQGLLFAALGLADERSQLAFSAFSSVLPWIGIAVAALTFIGVLAAYGTIDYARKKIDDVRKKKQPSEPDFGAMGWRKWLGRTNSLGVPVVIVIAWAALAALF